MFASNLYISTNAYVVDAQKNRLNLREREREFLRSKTKIGISVLPSMEITESFDALYTIKLDFFMFFTLIFGANF